MNNRLITAVIVAAGFLLVLGVMMVMSSSAALAYFKYGDSFLFIKRHLINAAFGIGAFTVFASVDYKWLGRAAPGMMAVAGVMLVLVLFVGVGSEAAPVRRWLPVGGFFVQPSEVAKFALVVFLASYLADRDLKENPRDVIVPASITGGVFTLVVLEPDFGMAVLITVCAFVVLFAAGLRVKHILAFAAAAVPAFVVVILTTHYRVSRLEGFLDPWRHARGKGYQIIQSLIALGSGGLFGKGLGASTQKLFYLPQPHTDFVYAILGEELGFIGAAAVVVAFAVLFTAGVKIAARARDRFGCYLAVGVSTVVCAQAAVNVGVCLGLLPTTGIPLPFISYGGASLVISMACVGILVNVARKSPAAADYTVFNDETVWSAPEVEPVYEPASAVAYEDDYDIRMKDFR
ncbi:MAG: putative lipid II flippase FtsW [Candidatus Coatesbacteria bacterium]|nr:MAG: putative lipid II flippase FtsW [Candidatus Coatesbacteria bacterium]